MNGSSRCNCVRASAICCGVASGPNRLYSMPPGIKSSNAYVSSAKIESGRATNWMPQPCTVYVLAKTLAVAAAASTESTDTWTLLPPHCVNAACMNSADGGWPWLNTPITILIGPPFSLASVAHASVAALQSYEGHFTDGLSYGDSG